MLSFQTVSPAVVQFELFPAAERNIAAFERLLTPNGVTDDIGWGFVDWGYVRNQGEVDVAVNMHFLAAVRDMVRWCQAWEIPATAIDTRTWPRGGLQSIGVVRSRLPRA